MSLQLVAKPRSDSGLTQQSSVLRISPCGAHHDLKFDLTGFRPSSMTVDINIQYTEGLSTAYKINQFSIRKEKVFCIRYLRLHNVD